MKQTLISLYIEIKEIWCVHPSNHKWLLFNYAHLYYTYSRSVRYLHAANMWKHVFYYTYYSYPIRYLVIRSLIFTILILLFCYSYILFVILMPLFIICILLFINPFLLFQSNYIFQRGCWNYIFQLSLTLLTAKFFFFTINFVYRCNSRWC